MSRFHPFFIASLLGYIPTLFAVPVHNETELATQINSLSSASSDISIDFANTISLTGQLPIINMASGYTVTINGNGFTLDSAANRGFFANSGSIDITNLTINNAQALGGSGGAEVQD